MIGKYLSEVIDYQRDIEPYRIIQIYSGVGSGKNHWVKTLAEQGFNILLITSRKVTADAQANKMEAKRWIQLDSLMQQGIDMTIQRKVVVTNAGIEQFLKKHYDIENTATHIWNYFDMIILDEAHSLVSDATFSDSPFHVKSFLSAAYKYNGKCKIIFMTGTNEPIENLLSSEIKQSAMYNFLDTYGQCMHVEPQIVSLFPVTQVEWHLMQAINEGEQIIYFANSISRIEKVVNTLIKNGISEENLGIAYADKSPSKSIKFSSTLLEIKKEIEETLIKEEKLPEKIKLFITTSKNKEGININDNNIRFMVSESCEKSALIQMAGRVRKGIDKLVILYDAEQHNAYVGKDEMELDYFCLKSAQKYEKEKKSVEIDNKNAIEVIEKKFPTIRFNYITQECEYYYDRKKGYKQVERDRNLLLKIIRRWNNGGKDKFQEWFPYSKVTLNIALTVDEEMEILKRNVDICLHKAQYLDREISKEEKSKLQDEMNNLLKSKPYNLNKLKIKFPIVKLNSFLKKVGYEIIDSPGHRKGQFFLLQCKGSKV